MIQPNFLFTDHAVLQRGKAVAVFGTCDTGSLSVSFGGHTVKAEVKEGVFMARLPEMKAGIVGDLIFDAGAEQVVCHDVVTGDVWIASGQSNMEHPTFATLYEPKDIAKNAQIRLLTVPRKPYKDALEWGWHFQALFSADTPWEICTPEIALRFSGVAMHFANRLSEETDVPIGIISCNRGATNMEAWISRESLLDNEITRFTVDEYDAKFAAVTAEEYESLYDSAYRQKLLRYIAENEDEVLVVEKRGADYSLRQGGFRIGPPDGPYSTKVPGTCWDNMLTRIMPYTVAGVLWYQGESNTNETPFGHRAYFTALMEKLVSDWRRGFGDESLPFYTVQLAVYTYTGLDLRRKNWAEVRQAQEEFADSHDGVYMVSALDIGELDNIHPIDKKTVGHRLAHAVLTNYYGKPAPYEGPRIKEIVREGDRYILSFDHARSLECRSGEPESFLVYDSQGGESQAKATIDGARVIVEGSDVAAIGYCYRNYAVADIYNEEGLPMLPFRRRIGECT